MSLLNCASGMECKLWHRLCFRENSVMLTSISFSRDHVALSCCLEARPHLTFVSRVIERLFMIRSACDMV